MQPTTGALLLLGVISQTLAQEIQTTAALTNRTITGLKETAAVTDGTTANASDYGESLFAPYDPDRHYVHIKYFEVGKVDFEHVQAPFFISCWILIAGLGKMAFHMMPAVSKVVPESCLLIFIGIIVGAVLNACLGDIEAAHHLDPDTFFLFMLPPIILDAGYFMPNRLFFDNLGTILLMAVVGTIFNAFTIGGAIYALGLSGIYGTHIRMLDTFLFSTLICAVDPVAVLAVFEDIQVNEVLYIVVFGESLLNDAVTVGLYHMFEEYVETGEEAFVLTDIGKGFVKFTSAAIGGGVMGLIFGLITAFFTRFTHRARVMEPLLVFIMSYLAYLSAEIFHFSGILSITVCGLIMKNYVITNVSAKSNTTIKYMTKMLSSSSETAIFMLLGVATVHNNHVWNTWFVVVTLTSSIVFRFVGVVLLTWVANQFRLHPISVSDAFIIGYGGLRGAVAFALVLLIDPHYVPEQQMFLTTTIVVVYFTVFLQGMTIKPLVTHLGIERSQDRSLTMNERLHERALDHITTGIEEIIGQPFSFNFRSKFKQFNHTFLLPILTRRNSIQSKDPKILETFNDIILKEALHEAAQRLNCPVDELNCNASGSLEEILKGTNILAPRAEQLLRQSAQSDRRLSYSRQAVDDSQLSSPFLTRRHQWEARQGSIARSLVKASQRETREQHRFDRRQYHSFSTQMWQKVRRSVSVRRNSDPTSQSDETTPTQIHDELTEITSSALIKNADNLIKGAAQYALRSKIDESTNTNKKENYSNATTADASTIEAPKSEEECIVEMGADGKPVTKYYTSTYL